MAVAAVIFDWGGTLTPWHTLDHEALWRGVCAPHFPEEEVASVAAAIFAAENAFWRQCEAAHRSATLDHVFARAGVTPHADLLVLNVKEGYVSRVLKAVPPSAHGIVFGGLRSSFANSLNDLFIVSGILALAGALCAFVFIRPKDFVAQGAPSQPAAVHV